MRDYEVIFIVKATETDEAIDALVAQMEEVAKQQGAEVIKVDKWGRRKLAYDIAKQRDGFYVYLHLSSEPGPVAELERRFKMNDTVIRFLSVRLDDEMRRAHRRAIMRARKKGLEPGAEVAVAAPRPSSVGVEEEAAAEMDSDEDEGEV